MKLELKHRFYLKSKEEQVWIQVRVGLASFLLLLLVFLICWKTHFFLPLVLAIPITLSVVASFFDVPGLKKSGHLVYYSTLFLSEKPKDGKITVHGGTLFDYVFVIDRKLNGRKRMNLVLQQYLEGLDHMIDHLQMETMGNPVIRGTSYIINERSAKKLGFQVVETDFLQKCILVYNYFNLMLSCSMAKGKLSWPRLGETKTYEAKLSDLVLRRDFIQSMNGKLKQELYGK